MHFLIIHCLEKLLSVIIKDKAVQFWISEH